MKLHVIGSGSKGNSYLLEARNGDVLVLEAGHSLMDVKKKLSFNILKIKGMLVTHGHL
jgi:metal-dependent hydrolase (beta-lactamase superfamily II)